MSAISGSVAPRESAGRRSPSLTKAGWVPQGDLEHPAWVAAGRHLGAIGRGSQWWIGDWLLYGAARWGEKYVEAARITGYDGGSLRNMASLSARFDLSRRRDNLTWGHHAAVAGLEPEEQDCWLDKAIELRLSVADLRVELRAAQRGEREVSAGGADPPIALAERGGIVCPHCGHEVSLSERPATASTSSRTLLLSSHGGSNEH